MSTFQTVRVLPSGPACRPMPLVDGAGSAHAVVWPGTGAQLRSMHRITLAAGSRTVRMSHPMEAVYYVIAGTGSVEDPAGGPAHGILEGSMVHVEPATAYVFKAGNIGLELVGGPCPADASLYR